MGKYDSLTVYRSEIVPPATLRNALPAKPVKKRKMKNTAALLAKATGKPRRKNASKLIR